MLRPLRPTLALLILALLPRAAGATIVDFLYALEVTEVLTESGDLVGFVGVGDVVTGHFRVNTAWLPDFTDGVTSASYERFGPNASVQVGAIRFLPVFGPPFENLETYEIEILDGATLPEICSGPGVCVGGEGPLDAFDFDIVRDFASPSGVEVDLGFDITELGATATLIDGLGLPASLPFPVPAAALVNASMLLSGPTGGQLLADLDLISLTSVEVPEPSAATLGALATLALARRCRSRIA